MLPRVLAGLQEPPASPYLVRLSHHPAFPEAQLQERPALPSVGARNLAVARSADARRNGAWVPRAVVWVVALGTVPLA